MCLYLKERPETDLCGRRSLIIDITLKRKTKEKYFEGWRKDTPQFQHKWSSWCCSSKPMGSRWRWPVPECGMKSTVVRQLGHMLYDMKVEGSNPTNASVLHLKQEALFLIASLHPGVNRDLQVVIIQVLLLLSASNWQHHELLRSCEKDTL